MWFLLLTEVAVHRRFWLAPLIAAMCISLFGIPSSGSAQPAPPTPPPTPEFTLTASNAGGMTVALLLPAVQKVREAAARPQGNGLIYTELVLPGEEAATPTGEGEAVGKPAIPVITRLIAVPQETTAPVVRLGQTVVAETVSDLLLYPVQQTPVDQAAEEAPIDYGDGPFAFDELAYDSTVAQPTSLVELIPLGSLRDLKLYQLRIAVAQYTPSLRQATVYSSIDFSIDFPGGVTFLPARALNPFEDHRLPLLDLVLNRDAVRLTPVKPDLPLTSCVGYEYLIITDPTFRAAADALAAWKWQRGISTTVIETGVGANKAGTTKEQIRAKIAEIYNSCSVRPSYLLLFGDAEHIPPWYFKRGVNADGVDQFIGTDYSYSVIPSVVDDAATVPLPDLALGRIPVDTALEALNVVNKIISYERTPPQQASFYQKASFASYFQCCWFNKADGTDTRGYIQTAEQIRAYMLTRSYAVDRIYTTSASSYQDPTEENYYDLNTRSATPRFYRDGSPLPAAIGPGSGFAWDGDTQDVIDAFNAGRFLIFHRDHGSSSGWIDPAFTTGSIDPLANGALQPVVYSINCTSGYFDNETNIGGNVTKVYFAEKLLRKASGGAIGVIAATRVSPTWENNALSRGLFDATWPTFMPAFGSSTSLTRLGDIMNHGKIYMLSQAFAPQATLVDGSGNLSLTSIRNNFYNYHLLGDPTLEMWTADPYATAGLGRQVTILERTTKRIVVAYSEEGALITVLQNGTPLARGRVVNGQASLDFLADLAPDQPVQLAATLSGRISAQLMTGYPVFLPMVRK